MSLKILTKKIQNVVFISSLKSKYLIFQELFSKVLLIFSSS